MMTELKPCPFCGVIPTVKWDAWEEISPKSGCYHLEANHTKDCYILHMNGTNSTGQSSAFNKECLIDWWNRRAEHERSDN